MMGEPLEGEAIMLMMLEMFVTGDLSGASSVVSSEYVDHQEPPNTTADGIETFSRVVKRVRAALPDLRVEIEDIIGQGDKVVVRLRWSGTAETRENFQAESIDIVRVENGKAAEHWGISRDWPEPPAYLSLPPLRRRRGG